MRSLMPRILPWVVCAMLGSPAWAGTQAEEVLSDAVRSALGASIRQQAPPEPAHLNERDARAYAQWLRATRARLDAWLTRRPPGDPLPEWANPLLRDELLQTVWYESRRAGLEPALVLGLIEVESGFRKFAISTAGARGLMQIMPFWSRTIGDGDASRLFHMQTNVRFGCVILRYFLTQEKGDLALALGRYNGSRGQMAYPNAVLAARARWLPPA